MSKRGPLNREIKNLVLDRDNFTCTIPGCGTKTRLHVHHIMPVKDGGGDEPNNLTTLCDIHHKGFHIEFSAYYPDSEDILKRMNVYVRKSLSKLRRVFNIDDGYDLESFLFFLTGQKKFRNGQLETIRAILRGENVLFVAPTGLGKSICYILPGLLAKKPSIVITPTISLMVGATKSIWRSKIPATYINSELGKKEKSKRYKFIKEGLYKFISIAPESYFKSKDFRAKSLFVPGRFDYFVVDEAHTIQTYGTSFRKSYKDIGQLKQNLGNIQTITLTATASKKTQDKILDTLDIKDATRIVTGIYRENIIIKRPHLNNDYGGRYQYLMDLIANNINNKILIFVPSVKYGENLQNYLKMNSIDVAFYHSKANKQDKSKIQARFMGEQTPVLNVLIATSAFGMGIDIPNIRHIIHFGAPLNLTEYTQQIGRAGRDGLVSFAHLLYESTDKGLLEYMVNNIKLSNEYGYSNEEIDQIKQEGHEELEEMLNFAENKSIKNEWQYLMDYFGEPSISFWSKYGIKILNFLFIFILIILVLILYFLFN